MGAGRQFSREFKLEAVRLVKDRGVSVAQAARDLDVHENVLSQWVRELAGDPQQTCPGKGVTKPVQAEIEPQAPPSSGQFRTRDFLVEHAGPEHHRRHAAQGVVRPVLVVVGEPLVSCGLHFADGVE